MQPQYDPETAPTVPWENTRTGQTEYLPPGVDPGWDRNPGLFRREQMGKFLVGKFEGADEGLVQVVLRDLVNSPVFETFLKDPRGEFPVARLTDQVAEAIGAKRKVAVLSADDMAKQMDEHPELTLDEYRWLPDLGSDPEVIMLEADGRTAGLIERNGRLYRVILRVTHDREETFMKSFSKAQPGQIESWKKRPGVRILYERAKK